MSPARKTARPRAGGALRPHANNRPVVPFAYKLALNQWLLTLTRDGAPAETPKGVTVWPAYRWMLGAPGERER